MYPPGNYPLSNLNPGDIIKLIHAIILKLIHQGTVDDVFSDHGHVRYDIPLLA